MVNMVEEPKEYEKKVLSLTSSFWASFKFFSWIHFFFHIQNGVNNAFITVSCGSTFCSFVTYMKTSSTMHSRKVSVYRKYVERSPAWKRQLTSLTLKFPGSYKLIH